MKLNLNKEKDREVLNVFKHFKLPELKEITLKIGDNVNENLKMFMSNSIPKSINMFAINTNTLWPCSELIEGLLKA